MPPFLCPPTPLVRGCPTKQGWGRTWYLPRSGKPVMKCESKGNGSQFTRHPGKQAPASRQCGSTIRAPPPSQSAVPASPSLRSAQVLSETWFPGTGHRGTATKGGGPCHALVWGVSSFSGRSSFSGGTQRIRRRSADAQEVERVRGRPGRRNCKVPEAARLGHPPPPHTPQVEVDLGHPHSFEHPFPFGSSPFGGV
jgi:hypothetical protein